MFQYSQLSRDGEVYHNYCLNYSKAINYLEKMRKNDDFTEFEKVIVFIDFSISTNFQNA